MEETYLLKELSEFVIRETLSSLRVVIRTTDYWWQHDYECMQEFAKSKDGLVNDEMKQVSWSMSICRKNLNRVARTSRYVVCIEPIQMYNTYSDVRIRTRNPIESICTKKADSYRFSNYNTVLYTNTRTQREAWYRTSNWHNCQFEVLIF